jgi:colicin import membrane protein
MEVVVEKKNETTVTEIVQKDGRRRSPDVQVVTPENFNEAAGIKSPETAAAEAKAKLEVEKKEKQEAEARAAKKDEPADVEAEEGVELPKDKKGRLNERFSELTKARKEAEERAAKREAEVKAEREARESAQAEARALKEKYEPVKKDPDPEPQVSEFTDVGEYAKALKEWTAHNTRREDAKKAEQEAVQKEQARVAKEWNARQAEYRKEHPDYEAKLSKSDVKVSDQVRDAILESEVGPAILEHFADNPDVAERIGKLTIARALTEVGRLESKFLKSDGGETKAKVEPKTSVAEISRAPAPITPIRGASAPVLSLTGHDDVPKSMSYEDWKKLRKAGKIR